MEDGIELAQDLRNFTGTENWYRHPLVSKMLYTDGVKYFAENAGGGAYWFLDIVATEIFPILAGQPFLHITMKSSGSKATITVTDGNENPPLFTRAINFTDCPKGDWEFYLTDNVLLLPMEN